MPVYNTLHTSNSCSIFYNLLSSWHIHTTNTISALLMFFKHTDMILGLQVIMQLQ